jgi:hypothetical protein
MTSKDDLEKIASEKLVYLTTRGRSSGKPHTATKDVIEDWFSLSQLVVVEIEGMINE